MGQELQRWTEAAARIRTESTVLRATHGEGIAEVFDYLNGVMLGLQRWGRHGSWEGFDLCPVLR